MQIFLTYLFLFLFGSFIGWLIEVFFRRFVSAKKWVNPGFMKGPWLPLYGFGTIVMFTVCFIFISFLPESIKFYNPLGNLFERSIKSGPTWFDLIPILTMWLGMNLLELVAGLIFIRGFKVKLWDYSNIKGNFKGVVCPLFSFIWLMVAVIFYYGIDPFLYVLSNDIHEYMFGGNGNLAHFGFIFAMGVIYGIMIYDFVVSINMFKYISRIVSDTGIQERYDLLKVKFSSGISNLKNKLGFKDKENKDSIIKEKLTELLYINPEKEKNKTSNYDEKGRPIKIDE